MEATEWVPLPTTRIRTRLVTSPAQGGEQEGPTRPTVIEIDVMSANVYTIFFDIAAITTSNDAQKGYRLGQDME